MPFCHHKSSLALNPQDILEGGNLRVPLQELHQMILTPIKAYSSQISSPEEHSLDTDSHHPPSLLGSDSQGSDGKDSAAGGMQQHHLPGCEGESGGGPLPGADLPGHRPSPTTGEPPPTSLGQLHLLLCCRGIEVDAAGSTGGFVRACGFGAGVLQMEHQQHKKNDGF